MKTDLGNAADHIRAQMNGLGKELWRSVAVLVAGGVGIGFLLGILYYRWISSPVEPASAAPQVQSAPATPPLKPPGVKPRQHSVPRTQTP